MGHCMNEQQNLISDNSTGATFSPCRIYRYALWRIWDDTKPFAMFIGLNPSTADEIENDPTVRRCINFAKSWGCGGLYMTNIFAFRSTDRSVMKSHPLPIGDENDKYLLELALAAGVIVCAWGTDGAHLGRGEQVKSLLSTHELMCLNHTKHGHPQHPLYVKADKQLERFL